MVLGYIQPQLFKEICVRSGVVDVLDTFLVPNLDSFPEYRYRILYTITDTT
jgi:hypothetical protein